MFEESVRPENVRFSVRPEWLDEVDELKSWVMASADDLDDRDV